MYVIVVGGGKTGSHLAELLLAGGHGVRVIDDREDVVAKLRRELPADVVVPGDGADPDVLERAGIREADVVAAVTGDDEDNLVVATLARFEFSVRRVIARVNNPRNAWLYTPEMGVDVALNQADLMAKLIAEEMSLGDMTILVKLRRGRGQPRRGADRGGRRPRTGRRSATCRSRTAARSPRSSAGARSSPRAGTRVLQAGDELIAVARADQQARLSALLRRG